MSRHRVIVFVKPPRPGLVKTRLAAELDAAAAAAIATVLLNRTIATLHPFPDVELRMTPDDAGPEIERWRRSGWDLRPQGEGDLGARLDRAFAEAFAGGEDRVVAIGTDCPALTEEDLRDAFAALEIADVVLGPAEDGGYWLVGLRAPAAGLFENIPWSSDAVLAATLERARTAGLSVSQLRRLGDVDTLEDWRRWLRTHPL